MITESAFNYQRYLASRDWALKRREVRKRCNGWCERCGAGDMVAVHHLTYERKGRELLEDLQGLCSDCHAFQSGASDFDPLEAVRSVA